MKAGCLFRLVLAHLFITAIASHADSPAKPNILWLVAEDLGPHLGCYGTKEVWTPNLDRLAAEGVRYARFFTTAPVWNLPNVFVPKGRVLGDEFAHHPEAFLVVKHFHPHTQELSAQSEFDGEPFLRADSLRRDFDA